ncbi:MAG: hypothetical protein ACRCTX_07405 [Afipia sp.]
MKATDILEKAAQHMRDRATTYDKPEGERSMGKTVAAFNAITGRDLTTAEGWLMLAVLKQVRAFQNPSVPHVDSLEDGPAYLALMAEEMLSGEPVNEAVAPPAEPAQPVKKGHPVKLAVGQVWKDRKGREVRIVGMDDDSDYPFYGSNGHSYTLSGTVFKFDDSDCDLIELIQDEHGWRPWKATTDSVCPVDSDVRVRYRMKDNVEAEDIAGGLRWNCIGSDGDIVGYKIIEEAQQ